MCWSNKQAMQVTTILSNVCALFNVGNKNNELCEYVV